MALALLSMNETLLKFELLMARRVIADYLERISTCLNRKGFP
jgi:hypothetical protein